MDSATSDEFTPTFYIGQHESDRVRVTPELLRQAQDCNYDMLTTPITTPYFHSRVLTVLSSHLEEVESHPNRTVPVPIIPSLSPVDTPLAPGEIVSQLLAVVSPWIDLCSPDPVVYNLSRQVLELEIAYASFCGIGNIILPRPKLHHGKLSGEGVTQYACAVQDVMNIGHYIQMSVSLPMMDNPEQDSDNVIGSLAERARAEYLGLAEGGPYKNSMDELEEDDEGNSFVLPRKKPARVDFFGTWDAWNVIRTVCKYNNRLFVALSIPPHLPPLSVSSRWHSEPLRLLCITRKTFFRNPGGYPAFTHNHQALLTRYMRIRNPPWLLLCDVGPIPGFDDPETLLSPAEGFLSPNEAADPSSPTPAEASELELKASKKSNKTVKDPTPHLNYLRNLQRRQPVRTALERFGAGYQDYLQAPLQPLTDNLESYTYEVFEKDPIKYDKYLLAIQRALIDWRDQGKRASGPNGEIVVAVVGAGRGPLVTRALQASESTCIPIEMWAIEKNQNAFVLLQRHNEETWGNRVNLVKSDMRSWKGPLRQPAPYRPGYTGQWPPPRNEDEGELPDPNTASNGPEPFEPQPPTHGTIDILVSELLGSFADNELSPECLDGILPLLNPTHGISIPASYTAYLTPIAAPKLHADISARVATDPEAHNTPYVVMLHAIDYLSTTSRPSTSTSTSHPTTTNPSTTAAKSNDSATIPTPAPNILPVWSFSHGPADVLPSDSANKHNERHARLTFNLRDRAICHGLAGYFEAVLYPGVELSTNPINMEEKSPGMMSWFPLFFSLKIPLYIPDASTLTVSIFRATDNRKVWYEWMIESWSTLMGGSGGGEKRRVRLGVSEVGSSKNGGCMM